MIPTFLTAQHAIASFDSMDSLPSIDNCSDIIYHCRTEKNLLHAKCLHVRLCNHGLQMEMANHLIPLFVDCGIVADAERVFHQLHNPSGRSWNRLIQGYVDCGRSQHAIDAYLKMRADGHVNTNKATFVAIIKACAKLKKVDEGRWLRADLAMNGLDRDPFVGSILIYMHAKFGLIEEAREIFANLPARDVVIYNSLLSGYILNGVTHESLQLLEQMHLDGVLPDPVTYVCSMKICSRLGSARKANDLHSEIVMKGLETDLFVGNTLVDTYSKCGLLEDALNVFVGLQLQDAISWTAIIRGCVEQGYNKRALVYANQMQSQGSAADAVTLVCILKACGNTLDNEKGQEVHSEIIKKGFIDDLFIGNALIDMYARCRLVAEAQDVFNKLHNRDVVSWNTLITCYSDDEIDSKLSNFLDKMQEDGIAPDNVTFICYLKKLFGSMNAIARVQETYSDIVKKGFEKNHLICGVLVDVHARCGLLSEAKQVFDKVTNPNVVLWNSLIAGYAQQGIHEEVLIFLHNMQSMKISLDPITYVLSLKSCAVVGNKDDGRYIHSETVKKGLEDDSFIGNTLVYFYSKCESHIDAKHVFDQIITRTIVSWNAMISSYDEGDNIEEMFVCLESMQHDGSSPNIVTFLLILKGCCNAGTLEKGYEIHTFIMKKGFESDAFIISALIDMYAGCDSLDEAESVFDSLPVHDVVSWTALVTAYAKFRAEENILVLLEEMKLIGLQPDVVVSTYFLRACGNTTAVIKGQENHSHIVARGLENEMLICMNLINMYIKCGLQADARAIFNMPCLDDSASWSALIVAYSDEGLSVDVLGCLEEMQLKSLPIDPVIIVCSLKACRRLCALDIGKKLHVETVKLGYDSVQTVSNGLMDMYAQCGEIEATETVFNEMPVRNSVSWNMLISTYAAHGLDKFVLERLEEMQSECIPSDAFTFSCILTHCVHEETCLNIHMETVKKGFENDPVLSSILMDIYLKCGLPAESRKIFRSLPAQDILTWTALVAGYGEDGHIEEIFSCLREMYLAGFSPSPITFVSILKACRTGREIEKGQEFHSQIIKMGFDLDIILGNPLLDMYVKCGSIKEAKFLMDCLPHQDVVSWTALIAGYNEHGYALEALNAFHVMLEACVSPSIITLICVLKSCSTAKELFYGKKIHADIVRKGYEQDIVVCNTLLLMYCKCGQLNEAVDIFGKMQIRDSISWTTLMAGYADGGLYNEMLMCFQQMQMDCVPLDVITWNLLIDVSADHEECETAIIYYMQMQQQGLFPDETIFRSILKACGNGAMLETGKRIHAQTSAAVQGTGSLEFVEAALIDMYGKCGCQVYAQSIFDATPSRTIVIWNTLLTCYARHGESEIVLRLLKQMSQEGLQSDEITFLCIINSFTHGGLVYQGQDYFERMHQAFGINPTVQHYSCVIDLLGRAGRLDEASALIRSMPYPPDLRAFNSMLSACNQWADSQLGSQTFETLQNFEEPDDASFILICNIFSGVYEKYA